MEAKIGNERLTIGIKYSYERNYKNRCISFKKANAKSGRMPEEILRWFYKIVYS
ncbi:hypothetical protein [uncultured Brachyspira sp.]|uniref:hypothetical protein n=1 Tax=uncultured Brachyspira sp. TaxID=221953 RepID=UPI003207AA1B